jgi:hypothetical protein
VRKAPNLSTKLAAALLQIKDSDGAPLIDWEHAKLMSAEQINSLFQWDHFPIRHEAGGPTEPWNLVPRFIPEHRIKTSKIDIPQIAKIRRITKAEEEFRQRLLTPRPDREPRKSKWPKRPIGKRGRS